MIAKRLFLILSLFAVKAIAFLPASSSLSRLAIPFSEPSIAVINRKSTILTERRWNFNEGQSPWGLKKNAEIWNGRVAQMAFVLVFFQELIQGKGVIQGIQEGDPINIASAAAFVLVIVGLTAFLAFKGDDDYVDTS